MRVRSLFISDVHLGCRFSRAEELFQFLGRVEPDRLYLVGDIIDGWKLKRSFSWNDTSSFVVRRILGMLKRGTQVYYATGNHDEFLRPFAPQTLGGVELADMFTHETVDGRRMALAAIRRRDPTAGDEEVRLRFIELAYGAALAGEVGCSDRQPGGLDPRQARVVSAR